MERKIGEIFEYNGEWYQCVEGTNCRECDFSSNNVTCDIHGAFKCTCKGRSDETSVVFKKLEKVGEPYEYFIQGLGMILQEYILANPSYTCDDNKHVFVLDCQNGRIAIELKQNQEDMEENKLNLKPFDLEASKAGKPVCTRDGRKARIICFDRDCDANIIALVAGHLGEEVHYYWSNGKVDFDEENDNDLMMLSEKRSGWINVYNSFGVITFSHNPYDTKEEALASEMKAPILNKYYIDTVKVEWEE